MANRSELVGDILTTDRFARNRPWQRFLSSLVGLGLQVSVAELDAALKELTGREGDARGEIYAYLVAKQTIGAKRTFSVGEALRKCGVKWSSGVVCLAIADHLKELVALFALLAVQGRGDAVRAALLAASCAVMAATDPDDVELADLQLITREALSKDNLGARELVGKAWATLLKKSGKYGRLFQVVPLPLRDAFASARLEDPISRKRRVFEDLRRWAISIAQDDPRSLAIIEARFACRARLDQESTNLRDDISKQIIYALNDFDDVELDEALAPNDRAEFKESRSGNFVRGQSTPSSRRKAAKGKNTR
jgi:hypothetical protein